jgi:hypothetical protein
MQCEAFEQRLNQLLDRRRPVESDDRLLAHAHVCPRCRCLLDGQRLLLDVLQFGETPDTVHDFAKRVVARNLAIEQAEQRRTRGARRLVRTISSLAALVFIALFVTAWSSLRTGGETKYESAHVDARRTTTTDALQPNAVQIGPRSPAEEVQGTSAPENFPAPETAAVASAESADFELYHELFDILQTASVEDLVADVSPVESAAGDMALAEDDGDQVAMLLGDWQMRVAEMPAESLQVDQIAGGLKPITEPFGVAFDLLRQTFPGGKPEVEKPQAGHRPPVANARFS